LGVGVKALSFFWSVPELENEFLWFLRFVREFMDFIIALSKLLLGVDTVEMSGVPERRDWVWIMEALCW
jgi:hypothetical protein